MYDNLSNTSGGGNGTQIIFSNGKITINEMAVDDVVYGYTIISDKIKINGRGCAVKYDCDDDKLIIYSDITSCGFGCLGADVDCNQVYTSYLTR